MELNWIELDWIELNWIEWEEEIIEREKWMKKENEKTKILFEKQLICDVNKYFSIVIVNDAMFSCSIDERLFFNWTVKIQLTSLIPPISFFYFYFNSNQMM